jgi:hypothetical protein
MNLLCDVSIFQVNHIFFLDTKKNMVIDGKFTKIVYSDSVVSLNGLYLYCPIESDQTRPATTSPTELVVKRLSAPCQTSPVALPPSKLVVKEAFSPPCQKTLTKNTSRLMATDDVIFTPSRIENTRSNVTLPLESPTNTGDLNRQKCRENKNLVDNHGSTIVTKKIPFMFSLLNPTNIYLIKELNRIEHEIIEHYKEFFQIHKTNVYSLRNQLKSGNIRVVHKIPYLFSDYEPILLTSKEVGTDTYDCARPIVVKISGIWETDMNIGITFKFQI